jgi:hypothetical protein
VEQAIEENKFSALPQVKAAVPPVKAGGVTESILRRRQQNGQQQL